MPRALSLKKQAGPSKTQKSITDFLKNGANSASLKQAKPEIQEDNIENKRVKRKAPSPSSKGDTDVNGSSTNGISNHDGNKNTPKKVKTENSKHNCSPIKNNNQTNKSPNKENVSDKRISPKKIIMTDLVDSKRNNEVIDNVVRNNKETHPTVLDNQKELEEINSLNNESCIKNGDKSEKIMHRSMTPVKQSPCKNNVSPNKTPRKSPLQELFSSQTSKSSGESVVKDQDFGTEDICDDFGDDWGVDDIEEDGVEDLDLGTMQRCEILRVTTNGVRTELKLKNNEDKKATCFVEGIWRDTPLVAGDIVSILATRDPSGAYTVTNTSGLLVLRPDHLISSTSVVAGVFCKRKAVLQERWRGLDSANMAMTTGILIHELVQKALTEKITSIEQLRSITDVIIKEAVERLYDAGLSQEEAQNNIYKYIPPLADFINTYVAEKPPTVAHVKKDKNNWSGHIDKILDIEENLCCPKLGLKGKIDATVQVTIHGRNGRQRAVVPLELKSGKASMSAEHRGQLVLYGMMLNLQNCEDPTQAAQRGLLLYLKDGVELREVSCGYPERRDLMMLRNQLVQYLTPSPQSVDPENLVDIEEASVMLQQKLPEPVDHHNACSKCPYLTLCSLHLWHTDGPTVSECHPLTKLRTEALGHLTPKHIQYFLHWTALLKMEETGQMVASPLHALWTDSRQRAVVPLELKSGKASMSAEHRGQLVLYGMMLNLQNCEDPTQAAQRGLLLYLKDGVELREVSCGYPERRDLMMLRNQLVQYLTPSPQSVDPENLVDIEEASVMLQQKLPEPVDHHNACSKCPYLTLCSLHLWHTDGPTVSECHPLTKLRTEALGHLTPKHIQYFLHWTALLKMEETGQMVASPLHALWTDSVEKRVKRGTCAGNLKLIAVTYLEDRYLHIFQRKIDDKGSNIEVKSNKGPQEGEFSIVSIENRPWIAAGVVTVSNPKEIHIFLERDVSSRLHKETVYHIDTYESYATTVQNLTNLGVLMEDSERADRLRKLIIDKKPPEFEAKLPRDVGRLGTRLMKCLNIQQQRAVLRCIAAKDYALMRGLPGTGKTQTISVLIQMLVALKQRVLVTAHTHSAVDTVLSRLPESLRVMRLGSSSRVAAALQKRSEQALTADCDTPEKLAALYDSMEVVGVTCLGAAHAMLTKTTFDLCIVDEATQVLQCTVLRPLFAAKRFVLVGDPEQLPPVVRSRAARRLGMEESLFHRLMCEEATSTLQLQYRMNQALADIANRVAYDNRLKCANESIAHACLAIDLLKIPELSDSPWLSTACSPEQQHAALFLDVEAVDVVQDVPDIKNSCANPIEACVVIALVEALKKGNVKPSDIGIIAPYRDQVSLLRRSLAQHAVEVSTVDQFQGRDKSVIIYSCTKRLDGKNDDKKVKEGEVLNDQRRLAVSVTRAKHKLLIVGNSIALRRYAPLQKLIQTCTAVHIDKHIVNKLRNKYKMHVT
uniref:DNA helicase n=1 Tax=Heliothis virescens TaxID=7102 RepID=A0A2A4JDD4_HELVI